MHHSACHVSHLDAAASAQRVIKRENPVERGTNRKSSLGFLRKRKSLMCAKKTLNELCSAVGQFDRCLMYTKNKVDESVASKF